MRYYIINLVIFHTNSSIYKRRISLLCKEDLREDGHFLIKVLGITERNIKKNIRRKNLTIIFDEYFFKNSSDFYSVLFSFSPISVIEFSDTEIIEIMDILAKKRAYFYYISSISTVDSFKYSIREITE